MLKKLLTVFMLTAISINVYSAVGIDSADRILNKTTPVNPNDMSALNADHINAIGDNILNGKYHTRPMKVWSSEYLLLISTADAFECAGATDTSRTYIWLNGKWNQTTPTIPQVMNFGIDDGDASYLGSLSIPLKSFEQSVTISSITFCVDTGTVTGIDIKKVSDTTPFLSGTSILGATIIAWYNGKYGSSSIAFPVISSHTVLRVETSGTTSSPAKIWGRITYTINNGN